MRTTAPPDRRQQLEVMSSTVWELENRHRKGELPLSDRVNLLRIHYEIQRLKEEDLEIPERDRSFLYLQEVPTAAVLLVPGGHSTPAQYFHLGRLLYRAGMTVSCSLLPNEAVVGTQRGGVPWQLTLSELEMRYERLALLGVPIHMVGSSFGGILALVLAHRRSVSSVTLLSPPLKPHLKLDERMALAFSRLFPRRFEKMIARSPHRWLADRYNAVVQARRQLGMLSCPVLAIHAKDNEELSPDGLRVIEKLAGRLVARTVLLDEGGHALLQGPQAKRVEREILGFIQEHQKGDGVPRGEGISPREAPDHGTDGTIRRLRSSAEDGSTRPEASPGS